MKKLTLALCCVLALSSCQSILEKKVDITSVKEDMVILKEKYQKEYTPEEFSALGNKITSMLFASSLLKTEIGEKTYGELLTEIHANKVDYDSKMMEYNNQLKELDNYLKLSVLSKLVEQGNYGIGYYAFVGYSVTNLSQSEIAAYDINLYSNNLLDKKIMNFGIQSTVSLAPKSVDSVISKYPVYENNVAVEFGNTPLEKIKFHYEISKIVLGNGTVISAPIKPHNPLAVPFSE